MLAVNGQILAKYIGLSSETKPTLGAQHAGTVFYESNTGNYYVLNAAGAWVQMDPIVTATAIIAPVEIGEGATSADSTVLDCSTKHVKQLAFTVAGTFAATAAAPGLRLQVFYSPDGTEWDTDAYAIIEPTFTASQGTAQTKQKSRPIQAVAGYYKCNVVNLDGTNHATAVKVTAIEVV